MIITYILIFIVLLIGLFLGIYIGFCILNFIQKKETKNKKLNNKKQSINVLRYFIKNKLKVLKNKRKSNILNKVNVIQDTPSYSENCYGFDVYKEEQDVKAKMKMQDEKYNILKGK